MNPLEQPWPLQVLFGLAVATGLWAIILWFWQHRGGAVTHDG